MIHVQLHEGKNIACQKTSIVAYLMGHLSDIRDGPSIISESSIPKEKGKN